ncbi:MAG: hypothetical protein EB084_20735 [Proteobacteria bacterium]|nr:hypothetical protein [Pseudomonadota bacterium]
MEVQEALSQVAEIRRHLLRTEFYRGYRSPVMAATSLVAVGAAAVQGALLDSPQAGGWVGADDLGFVRFWLVVAAVNLLLVSTDVMLCYIPRLSREQQRSAYNVVGQFIPSLCGAALVTWGCARVGATMLLPGLWCTLFSMGVFASRPYLPRGVGWVGLFYLACGMVLLALAPTGQALTPWAMGAPFGIGQLCLGLVLYYNLERPGRHAQ